MKINKDDILAINNFYKKYPQIYLRWINPSLDKIFTRRKIG
jgi:hypothetical protein